MTSIDIPDINISNSLLKKKKVDDYVNFTKNYKKKYFFKC